MGKLICICGKSCCGKDAILRRVLESEKINPVVTYTTRPMRPGETDGVEYYFTDEAGYKDYREQGLIIEERSYDTVHGLWRYFTVSNFDIKNGNYAMINTPEGCAAMKKALGNGNVITVLVETDNTERMRRAIKREQKKETPDYGELCRRFLADEEDFEESKLTGIDVIMENSGNEKADLGYIAKQITDLI